MGEELGVWVTQNLLGLNYWICYLGLFLVAAFICNELVFTLCGYLVFTGDLGFASVIWSGALGATFGAMLPYWLSLYGGRPLIDKYGKYFGCTPQKMAKAESWFKRYGDWAIFITRFIPGLRTIISFPAGAAKMSQIRYTIFTLAGTLIWSVVLVSLGYLFGERWYLVFEWLDQFSWLVVSLVGIVILWLIVRRYCLPGLKNK